jgi:hypothetical protein
MPDRKTSTTVYLWKSQDKKLHDLSDKTKVPIAEYIRQGIDIILEKNKHHLHPEDGGKRDNEQQSGGGQSA